MKTLDIIHKHEPVKIILFDLLTALLDSWTLWSFAQSFRNRFQLRQ